MSRSTFAIAVVLLNALSFASLAYIAYRKGYHAMAALAAAGAWLFGADLGDLALMSRRFRKLVSRDGGWSPGPSRSYGLCNSCALNSANRS